MFRIVYVTGVRHLSSVHNPTHSPVHRVVLRTCPVPSYQTVPYPAHHSDQHRALPYNFIRTKVEDREAVSRVHEEGHGDTANKFSVSANPAIIKQ